MENLTLVADPLDVPTKQYVDGLIGGVGGTTILSGTAAPTASTGADGNYYLDEDDHILYGPRVQVPAGVASIYTSQIPTSEANYQYTTFGSDIRFAKAGTIIGLRHYWSPSSPASNRTMNVWNSSGTKIATGIIPRGTAGSVGWARVGITPVAVTAGETVRVSVDSVGSPSWIGGSDNSIPDIVNGDLTLLSQAWMLDGVGYPNTPTLKHYFADVEFQAGGGTVASWPVALKNVVVQDEGGALALRPAINFVGAGVTATDDAANGRTLVTIPGASAGVTDHGALTGLADDDHPQYHNDARGDARYVNVTGDQMSGDLRITKLQPTFFVDNNDPASPTGGVFFQTNGVHRWVLQAQTAEGAGDAGSDLVLKARHNDGTAITTALTVERKTGLMYVAGDPTAPLGIATKQIVDGKVAKTGDVMTGDLKGTKFVAAVNGDYGPRLSITDAAGDGASLTRVGGKAILSSTTAAGGITGNPTTLAVGSALAASDAVNRDYLWNFMGTYHFDGGKVASGAGFHIFQLAAVPYPSLVRVTAALVCGASSVGGSANPTNVALTGLSNFDPMPPSGVRYAANDFAAAVTGFSGNLAANTACTVRMVGNTSAADGAYWRGAITWVRQPT